MRAAVLTVSDRASAGTMPDESGAAVRRLLLEAGFDVSEVVVVPDEMDQIAAFVVTATEDHELVVTTGGTGLGPRDVTPQATLPLLDYQVPGLAERMRAEGLRSTPMASLSRSVAGVRGRTLVLNLPGSVRGATESLQAVAPVLSHAVGLLSGATRHAADGAWGRMMLEVGSRAPDATLPSTGGEEVRLSEAFARNRATILAFYVLDFTPGWKTELTEFRSRTGELSAAGVGLYGISVDSVFSHRAFAEQLGGLTFELLADFERRTVEAYGVRREDVPGYSGMPQRSVFIVDHAGVIRWTWVRSQEQPLPDFDRVVAEALRIAAETPGD